MVADCVFAGDDRMWNASTPSGDGGYPAHTHIVPAMNNEVRTTIFANNSARSMMLTMIKVIMISINSVVKMTRLPLVSTEMGGAPGWTIRSG